MPINGNHILWLASRPTDEEYQYGRLIAGETGEVIRKEFLALAKIDPLTFSRASLWLHPINLKNERGCFDVGLDTVLSFASDKRIIILVGADAVSHFTSLKVSDVTGLEVTSECNLFPKAQHVFAMMSPGIAFSKGIGEVRFAINNIKSYLK